MSTPTVDDSGKGSLLDVSLELSLESSNNGAGDSLLPNIPASPILPRRWGGGDSAMSTPTVDDSANCPLLDVYLNLPLESSNNGAGDALFPNIPASPIHSPRWGGDDSAMSTPTVDDSAKGSLLDVSLDLSLESSNNGAGDALFPNIPASPIHSRRWGGGDSAMSTPTVDDSANGSLLDVFLDLSLESSNNAPETRFSRSYQRAQSIIAVGER